MEVEPIPDDKLVRYFERHIVQRNIDDAASPFVEQRANTDRGGTLRLQIVDDMVQSHAGVHDILDEEDIATLDVLIDIFQYPHRPRPVSFIRRNRHQIDR